MKIKSSNRDWRRRLPKGDRRDVREPKDLRGKYVCDHKVRFKTTQEALDAIESYYSRVVLSLERMSPYWCKVHKCVHIGHGKSDKEVRWHQNNRKWWKEYEENGRVE